MVTETKDSKLIHHTKETYGDSFTAHLFEQYKLYVQSAEKISERRVSANNYLLTVNAFLVTLYGLLAASPYKGGWVILVPVAGFLVSLTWHRIITSYRDLNTVKFKVIHELEREMPASLYHYEWHKAEEGQGKVYHPLTHLERWVPLVFTVLYVVLTIIGVLDNMR
jgi:L-asparagine transporter-like permease